MLSKYVPTGKSKRSITTNDDPRVQRRNSSHRATSTQEIYVARDDNPIIEAEFTEVPPPPSGRHTASDPTPRASTGPRVRVAGAPHQFFHDTHDYDIPFRTTPPSGNGNKRRSPGAERAFPPGFAETYTEHDQQSTSFRPWALIITPLDNNWFKVTIYGSRWALITLFLVIVLIGFSIDRAPGFLLNLLEILP